MTNKEDKIMKKVIAVLLGAAMIFALTGCGGQKDYLKYVEDLGYAKVEFDEIRDESLESGNYAYVDDAETLKDMTIDQVNVRGLEGRDLNSLLIASRMTTYTGEYEGEYSSGTLSMASGYSLMVLEYKDEDRLEEVFESIKNQTSVTLSIAKIATTKDTYVYDSDDDSFSCAIQEGNTYTHVEYFIDDCKLIIVGGVFLCKNDAYREYHELYDYMGRDCSLDDLKFEPIDEADFDADAYFANPNNMARAQADTVLIQ